MSDLIETEEWALCLGVPNTEQIFRFSWMKIVGPDLMYVSHEVVITDELGSRLKPSQTTVNVKAAATAWRLAELRAEYQTELNYSNAGTHKDILVAVAERAFNGEYVGQHANERLYLHTIADLFSMQLQDVYALAGTLIVERRIGLDGNIIIPFDVYEETRSILEKRTGHRNLDIGDWIGWSCSYCGKHGEETNPALVPCR